MHPLENLSHPDRNAFAADPFGYAASGWHKWENACLASGAKKQFQEMPTPDDLKSPILWLCQAHALSEAAVCLTRNEPRFESMPVSIRGVCDCQYMSVALMLVGYSLEVCLKGLAIIKNGIQIYKENEKLVRHHDLVRLADAVPNLTEKDKAILEMLTHFSTWAGRYPDPGSKYFSHTAEIFRVSEIHQITAGDTFRLSARIMGVAHTLVAEAG